MWPARNSDLAEIFGIISFQLMPLHLHQYRLRTWGNRKDEGRVKHFLARGSVGTFDPKVIILQRLKNHHAFWENVALAVISQCGTYGVAAMFGRCRASTRSTQSLRSCNRRLCRRCRRRFSRSVFFVPLGGS